MTSFHHSNHHVFSFSLMKLSINDNINRLFLYRGRVIKQNDMTLKIFLLILLIHTSHQINNGLGRIPAMGM